MMLLLYSKYNAPTMGFKGSSLYELPTLPGYLHPNPTMTRSIKHAPVISEKPVPSEKLDKHLAHKARRAKANADLKSATPGENYSESTAAVPSQHAKGKKTYASDLRVQPEGKGLRVLQLPGGGFDGRKAHKAVAK